MNRAHTIQEAEEQAALYVAGAMPADEETAFEAHARDCGPCSEAMAGLRPVADQLHAAARPARPSARVRDAVLERFAAPVYEDRGVLFVRTGELGWEDLLPNVVRKPLFSDPRRGYNTQLIRMAPGSTYPPHRHAEAEELFLIEGDITVCGVAMKAGDYCRAEADSLHEGIFTRNGCVFLALACDRDEILGDPEAAGA